MSNMQRKDRPSGNPGIKHPTLALAVASFVSGVAWGDDRAPEVFTAKKVTVSATRMQQDIAEVPRPVAVVEQETIETLQPQTVPEVLRFIPNVTVSGGPRAGSQAVSIRGLGGSQVLQTLDGARQIFESGHRPSYFIDPELIESVEVVKGPASSLWGSGAVGGVVAQNTISGSDLLQPDQNLGGYVKAGYNDNNEEILTSGALAGRQGSWDWLLSGYWRDSEAFEQGDGERLRNSGLERSGAFTKAEWQLDDAHALIFSYRFANTEGEVPTNGAAPENSTSNFVIERESDSQNLIVDYQFDPVSKLIDSQITAYWNQVEMDESRFSDGRADSTEVDVYGLNLSNVSAWQGVSLLYGIDAYREEFSAGRGGGNRPTPPEAQSDVWGAYAQLNLDVTEQLRTELGVRYDDFSTEAENLGSETSDDDLSPSLALIWQPAEALRLTLRHDRAFRAPGAEELYTTGTHFCIFPGFCNTFLSNPDLEAEEAENTELLLDASFTNLAGDDLLTLSASVFQNDVDNFIEQIVTDPTLFPVMSAGNTTWINVDEAEIEGFELSAHYQRANFELMLAYGQTKGEDKNTGEDLTNIPADTLSGDVRWHLWQRQMTAGLRVIYADDQSETNYPGNTSNTEYDGYTVADVYLSWTPSSLDALTLNLTVDNVTDRDYRRAWQQLDQPGREFQLSAKYRF